MKLRAGKVCSPGCHASNPTRALLLSQAPRNRRTLPARSVQSGSTPLLQVSTLSHCRRVRAADVAAARSGTISSLLCLTSKPPLPSP